jgi:hypothetical protein
VAASAFSYEHRTVPNTRVSVDLPKRGGFRDHRWDVGGTVYGDVVIGSERDDVLVLGVRVGPGERALADLENDHDRDRCRFSNPVQRSVCGRSAELVTVSCPERYITCVIAAAGGMNHPDYDPPVTTWALQFSAGPTPGGMTLSMPTAFERGLAPVVEHLLASIRCQPGT